MSLLGYLVPAFRELRGPLVGGYLWLLASWLSLGTRVPQIGEKAADDGSWRQLTRLDGIVGSAGLAVAASVLAVLIGSLAGELIARFIAWQSELTDTIEDLGQLVPESRFAVDRALRVHSEAELRLHAALPLLVVAVFFVRDDLLVGVLVFALAVAVGAHGWLLVGRWKSQASSARALADRAVQLLSEEDRGEREADIQITPSPGTTGTGRLHIQNAGKSVARQVDLLETSDGGSEGWIIGGFLPIEELRPGHSVAVPVDLGGLNDSPVRKVLVEWVDSAGEHSEQRSIYFT